MKDQYIKVTINMQEISIEGTIGLNNNEYIFKTVATILKVTEGYTFDKKSCKDNDFELFVKACRDNDPVLVDKLAHLINDDDIEPEFVKACVENKLDLAQCLRNHKNKKDEELLNNIFADVCKKGFLEIVRWLCEISNIYKPRGLEEAILNDQLEIVKCLTKIDPELISNYLTCDKFIKICEYGNLEMIKFIYSIGAKHCDINEAMKVACNHGHFKVVAWLREIGAKIE